MTQPTLAVTHHPHWTDMRERWARYRAFYEGIDSADEKAVWIPKGEKEDQADYDMRLRLAEDLGWSGPVVARMSGTLCKTAAELTWPETSTVPQATRDLIDAFRRNCDGMGRSIDSWWSDFEPDVLAMGIRFAEVARAPFIPTPNDPTKEPLPYLTTWNAEEVINWQWDSHGSLLWVVLSREVWEQQSWDQVPIRKVIYRVLDRLSGMEFEMPVGANPQQEKPSPRGQAWQHNLGMVPLAPCYAERRAPLEGVSYIDAISRGDRRLLRLESDQGHASYLHGSPQLAIGTNRDLKDVGVGASHVIKLNPGEGPDKEWAEYLSMDPAGMQVRETIIERTARQAMNHAGIDPNAVATEKATQGKSGVSLAYQFSASEGPRLSKFTEEMDACDRLILEIFVRYYTPSADIPPTQSVFDGTLRRTKKWDMLSAEQAVDLTDGAWDRVKSETWRRAAAADLATKIPGNLPPDKQAEIQKELETADFADPAPLPVDPGAGFPPQAAV